MRYVLILVEGWITIGILPQDLDDLAAAAAGSRRCSADGAL